MPARPTQASPQPEPLTPRQVDKANAERTLNHATRRTSGTSLARTLVTLGASATGWDMAAFHLAVMHQLDAERRAAYRSHIERQITHLAKRQRRLENMLAVLDFYAESGDAGADEVLREHGSKVAAIRKRAAEIEAERAAARQT